MSFAWPGNTRIRDAGQRYEVEANETPDLLRTLGRMVIFRVSLPYT